MPRDFLIPLLIPILIINAVLIVAAARAILRRSADMNDGLVLPIPGESPAAAATNEEAANTAVNDGGRSGAESDGDEGGQPDTGDAGRRRVRSRRFSLPPEDHERIARSIEAFLAADVNGARTTNGAPRANAPTRAATVAIVAIKGLDALGEVAGREIAVGVAAAVKETLRRSARGIDRVVDLGEGRFQVLLPATGERAAASYLRRVRAACDPWLGAAAAPVSLVVATAATRHDRDLGAAVRLAERRLERAVASGAPSAGAPSSGAPSG